MYILSRPQSGFDIVLKSLLVLDLMLDTGLHEGCKIFV